MTVGQIYDFAVAYDKRQSRAEEKAEKAERTGRSRKATQADIDAFAG